MWEPAPNELDTESEQQLLRAPNKIINLIQQAFRSTYEAVSISDSYSKLYPHCKNAEPTNYCQ